MGLSDHFSITLRTKVLFAFTFAIQFIATLYAAYELEIPPSFELLSHVAFLWIVALWIRAESKRTGKTWPLDFGMYTDKSKNCCKGLCTTRSKKVIWEHYNPRGRQIHSPAGV